MARGHESLTPKSKSSSSYDPCCINVIGRRWSDVAVAFLTSQTRRFTIEAGTQPEKRKLGFKPCPPYFLNGRCPERLTLLTTPSGAARRARKALKIGHRHRDSAFFSFSSCSVGDSSALATASFVR